MISKPSLETDSSPSHSEPPALPLSGHDEEKDIVTFQEYLHGLNPEALWDVQRHIDDAQFPRRSEAVQREIQRRRLFFVTPYSRIETRLRFTLATCLVLMIVATMLRMIAAIDFHLMPGDKLPYFTDLAVGSPKAAATVLPLFRFAALLGSVVAPLAFVYALYLRMRRQIRTEIVWVGLIAVALIALLIRGMVS